MTQIPATLQRLFQQHRIILWYDEKEEMREEFDALDLPDVAKIEIRNNEFGVKYRILRQQPKQKFLLYRSGKRPADAENWLLDVELAYRVFTADQTAIWLHELGLPLEFRELVQQHQAFFRAKDRREKLKRRLRPRDTQQQVLMHMLGVTAGADSNLEAILQTLLDGLAAGDDPLSAIVQYGLEDFFWEQMARAYGYQSDRPTLLDFTLALFRFVYDVKVHPELLEGDAAREKALSSDARVFFSRWKDSKRHQVAFETLSARAAQDLDIEEDIDRCDLRDLLDADCFEAIEKRILNDLVKGVTHTTLPQEKVVAIVQRRRLSHWFDRYQRHYQRAETAARFIEMLDEVDLTVATMAQGVQRYAETWYQLDQLYREFIHASKAMPQDDLQVHIDNLYANKFLHPLNLSWQKVVDNLDTWLQPKLHGQFQSEFYDNVVVNKFLGKNRKATVIISDALRYEAGEALARRIRQENRFDADITPLVTLLPSYTQLGMAALLPHKSLRIGDDATVLVDDKPSAGLENRRKILEAARSGESVAMLAAELLAMSGQQARKLVRDHHIIYIFHNRIDAMGDKRDTEGRVFEAVEETLDELVVLIKKLASANASSILITADHGFLYQDKDLAPGDYIEEKPGGKIVKIDRRFILGRGLKPMPGFRHWTSTQVGLAGDMEMLIPKSIQRLRVRGSGSRYVHGGAALQEIVIPLITVHKKREDDVELVDVEILQGRTQTITTGQISVTLYQRDPISDKVRPRVLRAGLYAEDGKLISNRHEIPFDSIATETRDRETRVQFLLSSEADAYNGQDVILRLEEPIPNTSRYKTYKTARYRLRRSFGSDFDF